jgi:hypothetical protein
VGLVKPHPKTQRQWHQAPQQVPGVQKSRQHILQTQRSAMMDVEKRSLSNEEIQTFFVQKKVQIKIDQKIVVQSCIHVCRHATAFVALLVPEYVCML